MTKNTMKCVTLPVDDIDGLESLIEEAKELGAEAVELRLDWLETIDPSILPTLKSLRQSTDLPMILSIRPERFKGKYTGTDEDRIEFYREAAKLEFDYLDLERDIDPELIETVTAAIDEATAAAQVKATAAAKAAAIEAAELAAKEAAEAAAVAAKEAAEAADAAAAEAEGDEEGEEPAETDAESTEETAETVAEETDEEAAEPASESTAAEAEPAETDADNDDDDDEAAEPADEIEFDVPEVKPATRLLISHYDLIATPPAYEIINDMKRSYEKGAYMAKLCYYTRDYEDTASIIEACIKAKTKRHIFSVFGTGDFGKETLTQSNILGCVFCYCALNEDLNVYPGQTDIETINEVW